MTGMNALGFPDGSWADPLSRAERIQCARFLARLARKFHAATDPHLASAHVAGMGEYGDLVRALLRASGEMSDLHLDVTERAKVATS